MTNDQGQGTTDKGQRTRDKGQRIKNKGQLTKDNEKKKEYKGHLTMEKRTNDKGQR